MSMMSGRFILLSVVGLLAALSPVRAEAPAARKVPPPQRERDRPLLVHRTGAYELRIYGRQVWGELDVLEGDKTSAVGPIRLGFAISREVDGKPKEHPRFKAMKGAPARNGDRVTWMAELTSAQEMSIEVGLREDGISIGYTFDSEGKPQTEVMHEVSARFPELKNRSPADCTLEMKLPKKAPQVLPFAQQPKQYGIGPVESMVVKGVYEGRELVYEGPDKGARLQFQMYQGMTPSRGFSMILRKEDGRKEVDGKEMLIRVR